MPLIDAVVSTPVSRSMRCRQVEALFDVPPQERQTLKWSGNVPLEARAWNVGLIVGPSGSGKSTVAKELFPDAMHVEPEWGAPSVLDDFPDALPLSEITAICQAVGFNTIPAWMRPYAVLSNGEKFRVMLARLLAECPDLAVLDEFTSVVDRQVAKIGSHAVQKYVRKRESKFVAVSCHSDIVEWLNPDWVLEPASMTFTWRELQRRPTVEGSISRSRLLGVAPIRSLSLYDDDPPQGCAMFLPIRGRGACCYWCHATSSAPQDPQHLGTLAARHVARLSRTRPRVRADRPTRGGVQGSRPTLSHVSRPPRTNQVVRPFAGLAS